MIKYKYFYLFLYSFLFLSRYMLQIRVVELPSRRVPQKVVKPKEQVRNLIPTRPTEAAREGLTDFSKQNSSAAFDAPTDPGLTKYQMKLIQNPNYNIIGAVFENELEIVRFLIRNGTEVDLRDGFDRTPLMIAATSYDIEMAQLLLEGKADVKAQDNEGKTPLHYTQNNSELARTFVLKFGADVNARDNEDKTPLHYVQSIELARTFVLELGANVNAQDINKHIPPLSSIDTDIINFLEEARRLQNFINNDPTGDRGKIEDDEILTIADWLNNAREHQEHPLNSNRRRFINWLNDKGIETSLVLGNQ